MKWGLWYNEVASGASAVQPVPWTATYFVLLLGLSPCPDGVICNWGPAKRAKLCTIAAVPKHASIISAPTPSVSRAVTSSKDCLQA